MVTKGMRAYCNREDCAARQLRAAVANRITTALRRATLHGRGIAQAALVAVVFIAAAAAAEAQPASKTVTLVVAQSPGGGVDRTARLLAPRLADYLHVPVVVENRDGGGTRIASDAVARAAPDGNTLLFTTGESTIDLAFDPKAKPNVLRDLTPVTTIAIVNMLMVVNTSMPVYDVQSLVARAREKPGQLNYATAGNKTTMHLVGELFKARTGTDIVHIPFKGTLPSLTAVVAGNVEIAYASLSSAQPFLQSGRLRALAVASDKRSPLMPDVPTLAESGVDGAQADIWYGVLAPAATPRETVERLADAIAEISRAPEYRKSLADMGEVPVTATPAVFDKMLRDEVARWSAIIQAARIQAE